MNLWTKLWAELTRELTELEGMMSIELNWTVDLNWTENLDWKFNWTGLDGATELNWSMDCIELIEIKT